MGEKSSKFVFLPLVGEGEGEEDIQLELTFSPQQTDTTIPSSTHDHIDNVLIIMLLGKVYIKRT